MYQRILVATDGSDLSRKAVDNAINLAATCGAELIAIKVVPHYPRSYFDSTSLPPLAEAVTVTGPEQFWLVENVTTIGGWPFTVADRIMLFWAASVTVTV